MSYGSKILQAQYKYYPFPEPTNWACGHYRFDQIKLNLLWLICPEIDELHDTKWGGNAYTESIDSGVTATMRAMLNEPPLDFMRGFMRLDGGKPRITKSWREDWAETMWSRARVAHERLFTPVVGREGNVITVNFTK